MNVQFLLSWPKSWPRMRGAAWLSGAPQARQAGGQSPLRAAACSAATTSREVVRERERERDELANRLPDRKRAGLQNRWSQVRALSSLSAAARVIPLLQTNTARSWLRPKNVRRPQSTSGLAHALGRVSGATWERPASGAAGGARAMHLANGPAGFDTLCSHKHDRDDAGWRERRDLIWWSVPRGIRRYADCVDEAP
jgi:hypothetical protein